MRDHGVTATFFVDVKQIDTGVDPVTVRRVASWTPAAGGGRAAAASDK